MMKILNRKGFTLIEILVGVLVIGILSALVYPKFGPVKERTYVAAMKNSLNKLVTAQENYMDANDTYVDATCNPACGTGGLTDVGYSADTDVTVTVTGADAYGFTAEATHAKLPNTQCEILYGSIGGVEQTGKIECITS